MFLVKKVKVFIIKTSKAVVNHSRTIHSTWSRSKCLSSCVLGCLSYITRPPQVPGYVQTGHQRRRTRCSTGSGCTSWSTSFSFLSGGRPASARSSRKDLEAKDADKDYILDVALAEILTEKSLNRFELRTPGVRSDRPTTWTTTTAFLPTTLFY